MASAESGRSPQHQKGNRGCKTETDNCHLPKSTRTALGKQGAKVARQKRAA